MWRKAMMQAITEAATDCFSYESKTPIHAGLYAIRDFEKVNKRRFDPFDSRHIDAVRGQGGWSRLFAFLGREYKETPLTPLEQPPNLSTWKSNTDSH